MDEQVKKTLNAVAAEVGTDPAWLSQLISFESSWDPAARNPISGARGLIQFMNSTARDLGYRDADQLVEQNQSIIAQLQGPVRRYLLQHAPLDTDQKLYMSVFYPSAMSWSLDREFPDNVQQSNPGIRTVRDYMRKVAGTRAPWFAVMLAAGIGGILFYTLLQR